MNDVLDLVDRWAAAEQSNDPARIAPLLAPEFVGVGAAGFVLTREQWLGRFAGGLRNRAFAVEEAQVHAHGPDAAVVVGVDAQESSFGERDVSGRFRCTVTAVRTDGSAGRGRAHRRRGWTVRDEAQHQRHRTSPGATGPLAGRLADIARAADDGRLVHACGSPTTCCRPIRTAPARASGDARGLHHARVPRRAHRAGPPRHAGHRRDVPRRPRCWSRRSPRSTCCPAAAPGSASARATRPAEAAAMGLPLPPIRERFERLEETLQIALAHLGGRREPVRRRALPARRARCTARRRSPAAPADPHRRHRRAPHAAAGRPLRRRLQRLRHPRRRRHRPPQARRAAAAVRRVGRPYDAIEKTISTRLEPGESAASFVERCRAFAELGIDHVGVVTTGPWTDASVATLATAAPALAD